MLLFATESRADNHSYAPRRLEILRLCHQLTDISMVPSRSCVNIRIHKDLMLGFRHIVVTAINVSSHFVTLNILSGVPS